MLEDAGIEPRTVATSALAVICTNHSAISPPLFEFMGKIYFEWPENLREWSYFNISRDLEN